MNGKEKWIVCPICVVEEIKKHSRLQSFGGMPNALRFREDGKVMLACGRCGYRNVFPYLDVERMF